MKQVNARPRFLMCPPEHFAVSYTINPWMDPHSWTRQEAQLSARSHQEWLALHHSLRDLGAIVEVVPPAAGLPDLVFTANAAVVLDRTALLARFRHRERKREEPHFEAALRALRTRDVIDSVRHLPENLALEGAGDCVFDASRNLFWMGYGPRSDVAARSVVETTFGVEAVALELADPRFYHMDTALCPLTRGEVMYVPKAFTPAGLSAIRARVKPGDRIEVAPEDAAELAANAVCVGDVVLLSRCSDRLRRELQDCGYRVLARPLDSFRRSGGSAFCLTLRLDRRSAVAGAADHSRRTPAAVA